MPHYVYACVNDHRWDKHHPIGLCGAEHPCPECGEPGSRIPQAFRHYNNPWDTLYREKIEPGWINYKTRKEQARKKIRKSRPSRRGA